MLDAMGGTWDRTEKLGMSVYSLGNEATPLINGEVMFASVLEDILKTKGVDDNSDDYIYYTAWAIQSNMTLDPRGTIAPGVNTTVGNLWTSAIGRGVKCLTLVWRNLINLEITTEFHDLMNEAAKKAGADESMARAIVDGRTKVAGSHHQKTLVVKREGEAVAYAGGIDLTHDRWDTPTHCCGIPEAERDEECAETCKVRETEPVNFRVGGWQDISVRLRGPAVIDVGANFIARWNDNERPSNIPPFLEPAVEMKARGVLESEVAKSGVGTVAVQLLRTYACSHQPVCQKGCYSDNAPDGDTTYLTGLVKAIDTASNYIYIEDQYGIYMKDVFDALKAALGRGVEHVVVLIQIPDPEAAQFGYDSYQADMWNPLKEAYPGKVTVYERNDEVYVHSKIVVVDDVWVTIGSQNMNYRSLTSDTEISVAMVDENTVVGPDGFTVGVTPFTFRTSLWASALGVTPEKMQGLKLSDAVALWQEETLPNKRVRAYNPKERSPFSYITQKAVDSDGRCYGWIKEEEEELKELNEAESLVGGFGGDISESREKE